MTGFLKFISPLVHPFEFGWCLLWVAAVVSARRGRRLGAAVCSAACVLIWLLCQPWLFDRLIGGLERPWRESTIDRAPQASAVVVLGGGWRASRSDFASLDLTASVDRLMTGFELCRRGRAPALVVGGDPPSPPPGMATSSDHIRRWFQDWKIAPATFHTLGPVRSTREEAARARELMVREGWTNVLLVTSAFHMRRSVATFEKAGVPVHPVACDFQVERFDQPSSGWRAFPDEEALGALGLWWHEQLGWLAYRFLGHL